MNDVKIPVLFTKKDSNYNLFPFFDCYDVNRNALSFEGTTPLIAHPPCRLFSRLRGFSTAPAQEKELAYFAMEKVRSNGGILEHPRSSTLWKECEVGTPLKPDKFGGYLISVNLHWFGYKAIKKTGLYIVGIDYSELPSLPLSFNAITHTISTSKKATKKELSKRERSTTPVALCLWLYEVVTLIGLFKLRQFKGLKQ